MRHDAIVAGRVASNSVCFQAFGQWLARLGSREHEVSRTPRTVDE